MIVIFTNRSNDDTYRCELTEQEWDFLIALNSAFIIDENWSFNKLSEIDDLMRAGR